MALTPLPKVSCTAGRFIILPLRAKFVNRPKITGQEKSAAKLQKKDCMFDFYPLN